METQGDHMTDNFEEFSLDSLELEGDEDLDDECNVNKENRLPASELRHCGDGAETKVRFCIFEYTIIIISRPLSLSELIPYLISLVLTHLGMEASIYDTDCETSCIIKVYCNFDVFAKCLELSYEYYILAERPGFAR